MFPHHLFLYSMRKLFILSAFLPLFVFAQGRFGYFSHSEAVNSLPQYLKATEEFEALKKKCHDEIERNEQELTRLYVAYLEGQRSFPEPILRKRQNELQQMVDNSLRFRDQLKQWLSEARDSLYQPSYKVIDDALKIVSEVYSLDYAIDSDARIYKYINPEKGIDITAAVITVAANPDVPVTELLGADDSGTQTDVPVDTLQGIMEEKTDSIQ